MEQNEDQKISEIIKRLRRYLLEKKENNPYLIFHGYGDGIKISDKFNVKIYKNAKGKIKVVTNDPDLYTRLTDNKPHVFPDRNKIKHLITIDDVGIGCPIGGTLVGVCLNDREYFYREVGVENYQGTMFKEKKYIHLHCTAGLDLVKQIQNKGELNPEETKIIICSGYINTMLRDELRKQFSWVEIGEIKGMLQDYLEASYHQYLEQKYGCSLYEDPKEVNPRKTFQLIMQWVYEDFEVRKQYLKSGWRFFEREVKP